MYNGEKNILWMIDNLFIFIIINIKGANENVVY